MFGGMQGVTTAIVAFIFAGVIWPHVIKHRVQFYAALIVVCFIILFDSIGRIWTSTNTPLTAVNGLLQIVGVVACVLSTGMSAKDLTGEVFNTIDVVRRGGEKETIIVPLRGEQPKPRGNAGAAAAGPGPGPGRIDLGRDIAAEEAALDADESPRPVAPPAPRPPARPADTSIPLE
jgi:hypothetical protein